MKRDIDVVSVRFDLEFGEATPIGVIVTVQNLSSVVLPKVAMHAAAMIVSGKDLARDLPKPPPRQRATARDMAPGAYTHVKIPLGDFTVQGIEEGLKRFNYTAFAHGEVDFTDAAGTDRTLVFRYYANGDTGVPADGSFTKAPVGNHYV